MNLCYVFKVTIFPSPPPQSQLPPDKLLHHEHRPLRLVHGGRVPGIAEQGELEKNPEITIRKSILLWESNGLVNLKVRYYNFLLKSSTTTSTKKYLGHLANRKKFKKSFFSFFLLNTRVVYLEI